MSSYNKRNLSGFPSLIEEGIVVEPTFQGRNLFRTLTDIARTNEAVICLRTQNPNMYRALANYCSSIYPGKQKEPEAIKAVRNSLEKHLDCKANQKGVIKGFYGGLLYKDEPTHQIITPFFKEELNMNLEAGDAVLVVGIKWT